MLRDDELVDINTVYKHILSLQEEVDRKLADLGKQLGELTTYVIEAKALERDRNLTQKIDDQRKRIEALEHALTAVKAFGWFASGLSVLLALWMAIKEVLGK